MNNNSDIHLHTGDSFEDGYRPGIIRIRGKRDGIALVSIYMEPEHLQALRDVCNQQLDQINRILPSNAPAEELAAPWIEPPPSPDATPAAPVEGEKVIVLDDNEEHPICCSCMTCQPPF
jgi:hypothetical protein